MRIYLAGGAVRDILLGRTVSDRDYLVTGATRDTFRTTFPDAREVGQTFPVFLVDKMEFSFPRAATLRQELEARDLTVNAQLLDAEGELICHPHGLDDLRNKVLRPASSHSLNDDPLRVFRAARFWAKLPDFTPHDELVASMREVSQSGVLADIPADRMAREVRKALCSPMPGNFLRLLAKADCLEPWFTEFLAAVGPPAGPPAYHDSDILEHICRVMDRLAGHETSVWMGLCHDLGKTLTPKEKLPHHHGHDKSGIDLAKQLALRLRLPNTLKMAGMKAAQWHMIAAEYPKLRPGTRVDLLMDIHRHEILASLFRLVNADHDLDHSDLARNDLEVILSVRLAPEDMNQGLESGIKLRQLRAQAIPKKAK